VYEGVSDLQSFLRMKMGEPRGGACAARTAVNRPVTVEDRVAPVRAATLWRVGPHHVTDAADRGIERMNRLDLFADESSHHRRKR
jgi:hypothetical protein